LVRGFLQSTHEAPHRFAQRRSGCAPDRSLARRWAHARRSAVQICPSRPVLTCA